MAVQRGVVEDGPVLEDVLRVVRRLRRVEELGRRVGAVREAGHEAGHRVAAEVLADEVHLRHRRGAAVPVVVRHLHLLLGGHERVPVVVQEAVVPVAVAHQVAHQLEAVDPRAARLDHLVALLDHLVLPGAHGRAVGLGGSGQREAEVLLEIAELVVPGPLEGAAVGGVREVRPEVQQPTRAERGRELLLEQPVVLVRGQVLVQLVELLGRQVVALLLEEVRDPLRVLDRRRGHVPVVIAGVGEAVRVLADQHGQGLGSSGVALGGPLQDALDRVAQRDLVGHGVLGHGVALGGAVRVDVHADREAAVAGAHHGQVPGQGLLDRVVQFGLEADQLAVGVAQDVADAVGLGRRVTELLGGLADELPGHGGVHTGPVRLGGLAAHVGAGVLSERLELGDHRGPVGHGGGEFGEVRVPECFEVHQCCALSSKPLSSCSYLSCVAIQYSPSACAFCV